MMGTLVALALLALVVFYVVAWNRHGRDPQAGIIIPRFYPPKDLSPAAMCYVVNASSNHQNLTAALINMAVKGHVTLEKIADGYQVQRHTDTTEQVAPLSRGEKVIMRELVTSGKIRLVHDSYDERLLEMNEKLTLQLKKEYQRKCFKDNRTLGYFGILVSVLVLMFYMIQQNAFNLEVITLLGVLAAILGFIAYFVYESLHRKARWGEAAIATAILLLLVGYYKIPVPKGVLMLAMVLLSLNVLFIYLLHAPTQFGRNLLDQIEGFKLYLSTAEQQRLELMHPPAMTPKLFEKYLPYAIALGIETQWSKQFARHLMATTSNHSRQDYSPGWYEGGSISLGSRSMGFAAICEDMETILITATDPHAMDDGDEHLL